MTPTFHITLVGNGFIYDRDGNETSTRVFQRENADEMFELLAKELGVYHQIYTQPQTEGDDKTQTPIPFTTADPDI